MNRCFTGARWLDNKASDFKSVVRFDSANLREVMSFKWTHREVFAEISAIPLEKPVPMAEVFTRDGQLIDGEQQLNFTDSGSRK